MSKYKEIRKPKKKWLAWVNLQVVQAGNTILVANGPHTVQFLTNCDLNGSSYHW